MKRSTGLLAPFCLIGALLLSACATGPGQAVDVNQIQTLAVSSSCASDFQRERNALFNVGLDDYYTWDIHDWRLDDGVVQHIRDKAAPSIKTSSATVDYKAVTQNEKRQPLADKLKQAVSQDQSGADNFLLVWSDTFFESGTTVVNGMVISSRYNGRMGVGLFTRFRGGYLHAICSWALYNRPANKVLSQGAIVQNLGIDVAELNKSDWSEYSADQKEYLRSQLDILLSKGADDMIGRLKIGKDRS